MYASRAVLFDLDDTLTATWPVKFEHHKQVAKDHYNIEVTDDELREHWGKPFDVLLGHIYRNAASIAEMRAANQRTAHLFPKPALPGAIETVTKLLDAGYLVGIVTSTRTDYAIKDLTRLGFPVNRLLAIQGADDTAHHKPDPAVFDPILAILPNDVSVTYVGDSWFDADAADAAGFDFIGVRTGLRGDADFSPHHRVVDSIRDVPAVLGVTP